MTGPAGYTIGGYPTVYRDTVFRSELEAHWACMFDLLGWSWSYENLQTRIYRADFVLPSQRRCGPLLVEIKGGINPYAEKGRWLQVIKDIGWPHPAIYATSSGPVDHPTFGKDCLGLLIHYQQGGATMISALQIVFCGDCARFTWGLGCRCSWCGGDSAKLMSKAVSIFWRSAGNCVRWQRNR